MKKYFHLLIFLLLPLSLFGYKPKIYDCFMYLNESEVLEIRMKELYPHVDYFVLVESNESHRKGEPKPFYFDEVKEHFAPYMDKIIHVKLYDHIEGNDRWVRENWHRNQIMQGLTNCQPEDIIIISDVDEIPPGNTIAQLDRELRLHRNLVYMHQMYRWFLNRHAGMVWAGSAVVRYKHLVKMTPQDVRVGARTGKLKNSWHCGWHFSGMGGYEKAFEKMYSIVEGYDHFAAKEGWRLHVNTHLPVPIDQTYPECVQNNIDYFIQLGLIDTDLTHP